MTVLPAKRTYEEMSSDDDTISEMEDVTDVLDDHENRVCSLEKKYENLVFGSNVLNGFAIFVIVLRLLSLYFDMCD